MRKLVTWILVRPCIAHIASFSAMAFAASPVYRRSGTGPGLIEYGIDSGLLALRMPGYTMTFLLTLSLDGDRDRYILVQSVEIILVIVLWGFTIWPLFQPRTKTWIGRSYLVLFPIWTLYLVGWFFAHLLAAGGM